MRLMTILTTAMGAAAAFLGTHTTPIRSERLRERTLTGDVDCPTTKEVIATFDFSNTSAPATTTCISKSGTDFYIVYDDNSSLSNAAIGFFGLGSYFYQNNIPFTVTPETGAFHPDTLACYYDGTSVTAYGNPTYFGQAALFSGGPSVNPNGCPGVCEMQTYIRTTAFETNYTIPIKTQRGEIFNLTGPSVAELENPPYTMPIPPEDKMPVTLGSDAATRADSTCTYPKTNFFGCYPPKNDIALQKIAGNDQEKPHDLAMQKMKASFAIN